MSETFPVWHVALGITADRFTTEFNSMSLFVTVTHGQQHLGANGQVVAWPLAVWYARKLSRSVRLTPRV